MTTPTNNEVVYEVKKMVKEIICWSRDKIMWWLINDVSQHLLQLGLVTP